MVVANVNIGNEYATPLAEQISILALVGKSGFKVLGRIFHIFGHCAGGIGDGYSTLK